MAKEKVTEIPDDVIEKLRQRVKRISHGTVTLRIENSSVVIGEVSEKIKFDN